MPSPHSFGRCKVFPPVLPISDRNSRDYMSLADWVIDFAACAAMLGLVALGFLDCYLS